ncbi:MAG: flagellar assembly protein A, partial [Candidatus Latescibacterota bacterium]
MSKAKGLPEADAGQDTGSPPAMDREESLEALTAQPDGVADPGDQSPIPVGLEQAAVELQALRTTAPFYRLRVPRLRLRSVVAGEVLRLGQEPLTGITAPLTAGPHVAALEPGLFRALRYGYLSLQDGRLSVLSPVLVDQDQMAAYWLLLDPERRPVDVEMILRCLAGARVIEGVLGKAIEPLVEAVTQGTHRCQAVLVASGRPSRDGQHALVRLLVPVVSSPEDGTHPKPVPVHEKQVLARRRVATAGEEGMDVCGTVLQAGNGRDQELKAGENVLVERAGN